MRCDLCGEEALRVRRAIVRPDVTLPWGEDPAPGPEFRESSVCGHCFSELDNPLGLAEIAGRRFSLAGASRLRPVPSA